MSSNERNQINQGVISPGDLEFQAEWRKVSLVCEVLQGVDLEKLRRTVEAAEAVGPILFPSEYKHQNLLNQRRVLDAALKLRDTFGVAIETESA